MRYFNTAGPVRCEDHYCLPPLERLDFARVMMLIEQKKYFVLHAPRQTGKTTCLLALMEHLNRDGRFVCLYANVEAGQAAREDVRKAMQAILSELALGAMDILDDPFPEQHWSEILKTAGEHGALNRLLSLWASKSQRPIVLFIDEIDSLVGDTLISVLRQIRAGYHKRPSSFPQSIILCGVRDVRDYRIHADSAKGVITGGSAFNIKATSLRLGDFSRSEVTALYEQHVLDTGQPFEPEAVDRVWAFTAGQPWLVNALGYEACFEVPSGRDRNMTITAEMMEEARERLILRRDTHIDQLVDKLQEERVRRVIEPILAGAREAEKISTDDLYYVRDLGLIRVDGQVDIANSIYREVIPRELTYTTQVTISQDPAWYVLPDGKLDMEKLIGAFQGFFREHPEHWVERFEYREAGPQLLMQAFLQRIVNSEGRIEREYGLGRMRTDLLVIWPHPRGAQKIVIELKLLHKSLDETVQAGLRQTWEYMDRCGSEKGHLLIFDRDKGKPWDEKIFQRTEQYKNKTIAVWGM